MTRRRNTSPDPVVAYAKSVLKGTTVAGPHVRAACRRHLDDLKNGRARGLWFDRDAADRAIGFFRDVLKLNGGQFEGKPFELQPPQEFIIGSLFGWKRDDGARRFRRAYIEQGKGNGKSPLVAGIGHYGLVADGEARAEIYAAGKDKDQAMVLYRDAVAMRQQSPALSERILPSGANPIWNMAVLGTGSFYRPISKEGAASGPRPHFALVDELHEHKDRNALEMLERGFKFRRQPLLLMITNSGTDRNSVCFEEHEHAVKVSHGDVEDDTSFGYVCALDENDDPLEDPSCWIKANPLLGVILTEEYLAGVVAQAKAIPGRLNNILRLHFCVWTDAEEAWMSRQALEAVVSDSVDPTEYHGTDVYLGLDLSATTDMTAVAYVTRTGFDSQGRPTYDAWIDAWTPGDTLLQRALKDKAPYDVWVRDGFLQAPKGKVINYASVAASIAQSAAMFRIRSAAYDRYAFRDKFEPCCDELGLDLPWVEHPQGGRRRARPPEDEIKGARKGKEEPPQGLWMPGSIKMLETLILEKRIRLKRNPVLISACMSATMSPPDELGNQYLSKQRAVNRIDAVVALAMAVGAATRVAGPVVAGLTSEMILARGGLL